MKRVLSTLLLLSGILVLGCKKDPGYEELKRLADEKYQEIVQLTQSVACGDPSVWKIATIYQLGPVYLPVHPSFEERYKKLVEEYHVRRKRADNAPDAPPIPYLDYIEGYPPIGIRCKNNKAELYYAKDMTLQEIEEELPKYFTEIVDFHKNDPCTNPNLWRIGYIRQDCKYIAVLYNENIRGEEFYRKGRQYESLYAQKRQLQASPPCSNQNDKPAKGVSCENGKPVIQY
ncbi:hypothetical protein ACR777_12855 [Sphingobacterium spiritivorum]|uniref:hypothetical protein n=1 Tax=Sphingobacterium spiritivorum TaxID=258 RepID=UPI003DA56B1B